jgi:hypothetical protein
MGKGDMTRVAFGLKARTGRAALVAVAGDALDPVFVERSQLELLPKGEWAPYHAAKELDPADADASVQRSIVLARGLAASGLRAAAQRCAGEGRELCGCAVLIGTGMPAWSTAQILAVHVRMHKAEGELFRDALVAGVKECGFELTTLPEKSAFDDAAKRLGFTTTGLDARLAVLGKAAGPPWAQDQKEAAAAALVALGT